MTKEQAIAMLKAKRECIELDTNGNAELCDSNCGECKLCYEQGNMGEQKQALDMAIKALEQQPSNDCVSRAELLKIYENRFIELQKAHQTDKQLGVNWCINTLKDMPPVIPTHKVGKWIKKSQYGNDYCSECDYEYCGYDYPKYCPNCGAKMRGRQK